MGPDREWDFTLLGELSEQSSGMKPVGMENVGTKVFNGFPNRCDFIDMAKRQVTLRRHRRLFCGDDPDFAFFPDRLDLGLDIALRDLWKLSDDIHDAERLHDRLFHGRMWNSDSVSLTRLKTMAIPWIERYQPTPNT